MVSAAQDFVNNILFAYARADAAGERSIGCGAVESLRIGQVAFRRLWAKNEALARGLLDKLGVEVGPSQTVKGSWMIAKDGSRIACAMVGNRTLPHAGGVDCYSDATWYIVDPKRPTVGVIYWPGEPRYDAETGRTIPETRPSIMIKTLDVAVS